MLKINNVAIMQQKKFLFSNLFSLNWIKLMNLKHSENTYFNFNVSRKKSVVMELHSL